MSTILCIDSSDRDRICAQLREKGNLVATMQRSSRNGHSATILPAIQKLLRQAKKKLEDIDGITVVEGPGPFTAVRVGVVIANALAWALGVPVHGCTREDFKNPSQPPFRKGGRKRGFRPVMPKYGMEPNITITKS